MRVRRDGASVAPTPAPAEVTASEEYHSAEAVLKRLTTELASLETLLDLRSLGEEFASFESEDCVLLLLCACVGVAVPLPLWVHLCCLCGRCTSVRVFCIGGVRVAAHLLEGCVSLSVLAGAVGNPTELLTEVLNK